MTIDELIEKYSKPSILQLSGTNISIVETGKVKSDLLQLKEDLKNLSTIEYSRKVRVPKFIADWIEQSKGFDEDYQAYDQDNAITLQNAIDVNTGGITIDIVEWLWHVGNDELFARAWLDGYEVEEEPKYLVRKGEKYLAEWGNTTSITPVCSEYRSSARRNKLLE